MAGDPVAASRDDSADVLVPLDAPAPTDRFGGHQRVADAIARFVATDGSGGSIGLQGPWGSGKSTVVGLLEANLLRQSHHWVVFIFDAWRHQDDPLRRVFLEGLIAKLEKSAWIDGGQKDQFAAVIDPRRRVVETRATPRLTVAGRIISFAALLVPLGLALFAANVEKGGDGRVMRAGLGLLVLPVLVVLAATGLTLLCRGLRLQRDRSGPLGWLGRRRVVGRLAAQSVTSYLASTRSESTTTESLEDGNPTSYEFEKIFLQVMEPVLASRAERRVLIVFDNIDRVPTGDAKALLATLQSFSHDSLDTTLAAGRVWTLLPFDPSAMEELWGRGGSTQLEMTDKAFRVVFDAPPLVRSDWRTFLSDCLGEADPDADSATREQVVQLVDAALRESSAPPASASGPTPRLLKQFVAHYSVARGLFDDLEPVHVAYFVILRRRGVNVAEALLSQRIPDETSAHLFDFDAVRRDLAGMWFGTSAATGTQLLLMEPISDALQTGDASALSELSGIAGFWAVTESMPFASWATNGGRPLTTALWTLSESNLLDAVEAAAVRSAALWAAERSETDVWDLVGPRCGSGARVLEDLLKRRDKSYRLGPRIRGAGESSGVSAQQQLEGVAAFIGDAYEPTDLPPEGIPVQVDESEALAALAQFYEIGTPAAWAAVSYSLTQQEVAAAISSVLGGDRSPLLLTKAVKVLVAGRDQVDVTAIYEAVASWLNAGKRDESEERLLDALRAMEVLQNAEGVPAAEGVQHVLLRSAAEAADASWPQAFASGVALLLEGATAPSEVTGLTAELQAMADQVTGRLSAADPGVRSVAVEWVSAEDFRLPRAMAVLQRTAQFDAWYADLLGPLVGSGSGRSLLRGHAQDHYNVLSRVLTPEELAQVLPELATRDGIQTLRQASLLDLPLAQKLFELSADRQASEALADWAVVPLKEMSAEEWTSELSHGDSSMPVRLLAGSATARFFAKALEKSYERGLRQFVSELAGGLAGWIPSNDEATALYGAMPIGVRAAFLRAALARVTADPAAVQPGLWDSFGWVFGQQRGFFASSEVVQVVLPRLAEGLSVAGLRWAQQMLKRHPDVVGGASETDRSYLRLTIADALERSSVEGNDTATEVLHELLVEIDGGSNS